jgi:chemotaxis protein MotB
MARKKGAPQDEIRGDEWLATYSDTVTLLLTFFVLLYSMATLDVQKMQKISQAFQVVMSGETGDTILEYDLYNGQVPLIGGESPIEETVDETDVEQSMYFQLKNILMNMI